MVSLASAGCQRAPVNGGSGRLIIRAPKSLNAFNKTGGVGSMASMPSDRKACYGVRVTGKGIDDGATSQCNPLSGIRVGFVEPGKEIVVQVPKGPGRTVELYAYLLPTGSSDACPSQAFQSDLKPEYVVATYKIGVAPNLEVAQDTPVDIVASFPGVSNTIASDLSLPAACTAVTPAPSNNRPGLDVSSGKGVAVGATYRVIGSAGVLPPRQTATGSTYKLVIQ